MDIEQEEVMWREFLKNNADNHGIDSICVSDFKNENEVKSAIHNYLKTTLAREDYFSIDIVDMCRYIKDNQQFVFLELTDSLEGDWKHTHAFTINRLSYKGIYYLDTKIDSNTDSDYYEATHYLNLTLEVKSENSCTDTDIDIITEQYEMTWRQNLKMTAEAHCIGVIYEPDFENKKKVEKAILKYLNTTLDFSNIDGRNIGGLLNSTYRFTKDGHSFVFCELKYHIKGDWKHAHTSLINYLATQGFVYLYSIEKNGSNDWYKADHYFNLTLEVKDCEEF